MCSRRIAFFGILWAAAGCLFLSCSGKGMRALVLDVHGLETEVYQLDFEKGDILQAIEGRANRRIRIEDIGIIKISPEETETFEGELYYLAEIWLVDGSQIIPRITPEGSRIGAFLNVKNTVYGKTPTGDFTIKLRNVKQIKFRPRSGIIDTTIKEENPCLIQ